MDKPTNRLAKASLLFITIIALLTSCGDSSISAVKESSFSAYPDAEVGDTLEYYFDSTDWDAEEKGGRTIVTFTGQISDDLHEKARRELGYTEEDIKKFSIEKHNSNRSSTLAMYKPKEKNEIYRKHSKDTGYTKEANLKIFKDEQELLEDFMENEFWKEGTNVVIKWVVYPNDSGVEVSTFSGDKEWLKRITSFTKFTRVVFAP